MRRSGLATTSGSAGTGPGNDTGVWLIMTIILFALLCNYSRTICLIDVGTEGPASSVEPVKPASTAGVAERERRLARYQEVIRLRQQGAGIAAIAQALRIGPGTVRRYLQAGGFPERHRPRSRPSILDPYIEYVCGGVKIDQ